MTDYIKAYVALIMAIAFFAAALGVFAATVRPVSDDNETAQESAYALQRDISYQIQEESENSIIPYPKRQNAKMALKNEQEKHLNDGTDVITQTETEIPIEAIGEWLESEVEEQIAVEVAEREYNSPLPLEHDLVLREVCADSGVPYAIALALIWHESRFDPYAYNASSGCFGYCQLHPQYFAWCSPEDNLRKGIGWLGELIRKHSDLGTALTVYAVGHDNGSRVFALEIMGIAKEWGYVG